MEVRRSTEPEELQAFLRQNPQETAYALGDLEPMYWGDSVFWGAYENGMLQGIALYFYGFEIPSLSLHGRVEAAMAILSRISLEPEAFCLMPAAFRPLLEPYFDLSHVYDLFRMTIRPQDLQHPRQWRDEKMYLRRLKGSDVAALNKLYTQAADPNEAIMSFLPRQIEFGMFYGVENTAGQLLAAAGTHVMSKKYRVGTVGNVFTLPSQRNKGLGGLTTAAVTQALFEEGLETVVLNVKEKNVGAISVYQKLGYMIYGKFIEGPIQLK